MRSASKHWQFFTACRTRCFSGRETLSTVHPMAVGLTLLTGSMIAFTAAFSLEALVFSHQLWAKLSVGVVLAVMVLLITWCVWTTVEAQADFSVLERVHFLKDRLVCFTRRLRGKTHEPGPDTGDEESRINSDGGESAM